MRDQKRNNSGGPGARERLMAAAIELFADRGYASTYVRKIVARAGVTKPVLYYYFENKESMFRAILDRAAEEQEAILTEVLDTPGTVRDRLIYLYRRIYQGLMEHQDLFKMIHNLVFGPPQGAPEYDLDRFQRRMVEVIKTIYQEGLARGEVREADPEEVAIMVLSLLDFCIHLDQAHPEEQDSERPQRVLRLAFEGLSKPGLEPEAETID